MFTGTALAGQAASSVDPSLVELLRPVVEAAVSGQPLLASFPRDIQAVEFTNHGERGASHTQRPAINVPTVDGYPVNVDVTVLYRIADDSVFALCEQVCGSIQRQLAELNELVSGSTR